MQNNVLKIVRKLDCENIILYFYRRQQNTENERSTIHWINQIEKCYHT